MGFVKFIIIFSVITGSICVQANEWQLAEEGFGIKVFQKDIPSSPLDRVRAESVIQADIQQLALIMEDIESFSMWMFACIDSKVVEQENGSNLKLYYVHETPWPYKNRDVVLDIKSSRDNQVNWLKVDMNSINSDYAPNSNLVRMESMQGSWYFKKIADNLTSVEFELYVDPAGNVPFPFVNSGNVNVVFETFKGLKRKANSQAFMQEVEAQESQTMEKALIDSGVM